MTQSETEVIPRAGMAWFVWRLDYGLNNRGIEVRFQARASDSFLLHVTYTGPSALNLIDGGGPDIEAARTRRRSLYRGSSFADFKNEWSNISTPCISSCSHGQLLYRCHFVNTMGNRSEDYPDVCTNVDITRWRRSARKEDVEVGNHEDEKGKEMEAIE